MIPLLGGKVAIVTGAARLAAKDASVQAAMTSANAAPHAATWGTPMRWRHPNVASGVETIGKRGRGQPEDVAAAAFLAVDGGRLARP